MLHQLAADGRDAGVAPGPPHLDLATDVVDEGALLAPLTGEVEVEPLLLCWVACFLRDAGIGMNDSLGRLVGTISPVGPFGPTAKCCAGGS